MEKALQIVDDIAQKDKVSTVLTQLHDSIFDIAKKLENNVTRDELRRFHDDFEKNYVNGFKNRTLEECIDSLKIIYSDFLKLQESVLNRLDTKNKAVETILASQEVNGGPGSDGLNSEISSATRMSENPAELQTQMNEIIEKLQGLNDKMKASKLNLEEMPPQDLEASKDGGSPMSNKSDLTVLRSAFDPDTMNSEIYQKQMESFVGFFDKLKGDLNKNKITGSEVYSEFSSDKEKNPETNDGDDLKNLRESELKNAPTTTVGESTKDIKDSEKLPQEALKRIVSPPMTEPSNVDGAEIPKKSIQQTIDKLKEDASQLQELMKNEPPPKPAEQPLPGAPKRNSQKLLDPKNDSNFQEGGSPEANNDAKKYSTNSS